MALEHDVALHFGTSGDRIDVWDGYRVTLSMLQAGQPWSFALWKSEDPRRATSWDRLRDNLRFGERVFLSIDGALRLNGIIGRIRHETDPQRGEFIVLSGRDLAGRAQSWDADPTVRLKGLSLEDALTRLFAPLGVVPAVASAASVREVQMGTARGPRGLGRTRRRSRVDYAHPRPGETVWQVAEALCRRLGFMCWVGPHPDLGLTLVVDVPAYSSPVMYDLFWEREESGAVRTNLLTAAHEVQIEDIPTEVTVYANTAGGEAVSARLAARVENGALAQLAILGPWPVDDALVQPRYVRSQRARTQAQAQREAERTLADANTRLRTFTCKVQGHGQAFAGETTLYAPNTLARVRDARRGMDEPMLILELVDEGSADAGRTTELTLGPVGAIQLTPEEA